MDYFKINYDKLRNLKQWKFSLIIIFVILFIVLLVIIASTSYIHKKISLYGIYNDGVIQLQINSKLSEVIEKNKEITFNNKKTFYKISSFGNYEIIDNNIYQTIFLTIDSKKFQNNEVGKIELYYEKQKIIKFILELFK